MADGAFISDATAAVGTYRRKGRQWLRVAGGIRPRRGRDLQGRYLSFAEREEIALARARGETIRAIVKRVDRSPSTISRELRRNGSAGGYRATVAHAQAYERAGRLKRDFVDDVERRVCAETIYQSLYVQSRGALKRELTRSLRTAGRSVSRRGSRDNARTRSRTWSTSASVPLRSKIVPCQDIGRAI